MNKNLIIALIVVFVIIGGSFAVNGVITSIFTHPANAMGEKPETTESQPLAEYLNQGLPAIVKLGADWCPPCRQMKPILKELAKELKGKVIVLDLDIEKHRDLAEQYGISSIPTTLFYNSKGKLKKKVVGFIGKDQILNILKTP